MNLSSEMTKLPRFRPFCVSVDLLSSPGVLRKPLKVASPSCVRQIEPDNCLIRLQPAPVAEVRNKPLVRARISGKKL